MQEGVYVMVTKDDLIDVFEDTKQWYETDKNLKQAVANSIRNTVVFKEDNYPDYKATNEKMQKLELQNIKHLKQHIDWMKNFQNQKFVF